MVSFMDIRVNTPFTMFVVADIVYAYFNRPQAYEVL